MNKTVHLSLRAGERIFVNGAVLRPDRKVSVEILNDAVYLLESHILQPEETTTPLKQLYFIVQTLVMDPRAGEDVRQMLEITLTSLLLAFANERVLAGLITVRDLVANGSHFEALRTIRELFSIEESILDKDGLGEARLLEAV